MASPVSPWREESSRALSQTTTLFHDQFVNIFDTHFRRIFRYLDRLTGEPDLAADLAQEAFIRLHRRGALPDAPEAWLITVAMNLLRNVKSAESRRRRLLTVARGARLHSAPPPTPEQALAVNDTDQRVRSAIDRLPERERCLLLLRAEGYSYGDIAAALKLNEASVGTLLARARRGFRNEYGNERDAS